MQNVDFSSKIRREHAEVRIANQKPVKASVSRSNRTAAFLFGGAILIFTAGLYSGVKLSEIRNYEASLIQNPDGPTRTSPSQEEGNGMSDMSSVTMSNRAPNSSASISGTGSFLIKIGTYSEADAETIAGQINDVDEITAHQMASCKNVNEVQDRHPAFRTRVRDSDRQNVFVGCFSNQDEAQAVLRKLRQQNLPESSELRIFEIE